MKTYTLKSVLRRGSMLAAAFVVAGAAILPAASVSADALNPLTERSLTLSTSSPGWSNKDGSGNTTYAQPNSGANGEKTGNTFAFRVSSDTTTGTLAAESVKGITFQYCTTSAGNCKAPGNNDYIGTAPGSYTGREVNGQTMYDAEKSDLNVVTATPTEVSTGNFTALFNATTGQPTSAANIPNRNNSQGNFIVLTKNNLGDSWTANSGWAMASSNEETGTVEDGTAIDTNNFIKLTNSGTGLDIPAGAYVKVIFFGTDTNYITNPGRGAFFVKINTYNSDTAQTEDELVDGGVTVANVMNRSIEIQTKVLETMDFSVGTVDPNTLDSTGGLASQYGTATGRPTHGVCDPILPGMTVDPEAPNTLQMGDADGEFSLRTQNTFSTHSYWRLSSNSSAGATVYYSGVTLSNTVGDQIRAVNNGNGVKAAPTPGSEQFGLALDNGSDTALVGPHQVSYDVERDNSEEFMLQNGADNATDGLHTASLTADNVISNGSWHNPRLFPLDPAANYNDGTGNVNLNYGTGGGAVDTAFAFDNNSTLIPTPIASQDSQVVDCVTAKVRYIANIAATTPAGIYTTKINYIAAPQY